MKISVARGGGLFGPLTPTGLAKPCTRLPIEKPGDRKGFRQSEARRKGAGAETASQAVEYHPQRVRGADAPYEFCFIDQRSAVFAGQS